MVCLGAPAPVRLNINEKYCSCYFYLFVEWGAQPYSVSFFFFWLESLLAIPLLTVCSFFLSFSLYSSAKVSAEGVL